ncbi:MAG: hypothetical protein MR842_06325 [Clostridiales bacterium]|nr:hypothetical protein [Clostridiales bacterium]MDY4008392.1 hypothetical protein [Candidatus Limiplasma sp.]
MRNYTGKRKTSDILGTILFIILVLSAVYSLVRAIAFPQEAASGQAYTHSRSDYVLMFVQCLLGLVVLSLPSIMSHKWKLGIPNFIYIMYYIFLYCAIFLGEVLDFYYLIPFWDIILHFFSGAMLGALGFILVSWLNDSEQVRVSLSPAFVALFAFCFALSCGALWEIYEYTFDGLLGLNMQKFITASGETLVGHAALRDTMKDIIVDAVAALLMAVLGYGQLKLARGGKSQRDMPR